MPANLYGCLFAGYASVLGMHGLMQYRTLAFFQTVTMQDFYLEMYFLVFCLTIATALSLTSIRIVWYFCYRLYAYMQVQILNKGFRNPKDA